MNKKRQKKIESLCILTKILRDAIIIQNRVIPPGEDTLKILLNKYNQNVKCSTSFDYNSVKTCISTGTCNTKVFTSSNIKKSYHIFWTPSSINTLQYCYLPKRGLFLLHTCTIITNHLLTVKHFFGKKKEVECRREGTGHNRVTNKVEKRDV